MSARFKVGDLVVRNPEARNEDWPYGGEVCRVVGHYPNLSEIIVVPISSPPLGHPGVSGWIAERFSPAEGFADRQARRNDPATSKAAAKGQRVNKYEQAVLAILKGLYTGQGYTGKQIATLTGHPLNCITPRFAPLRRKGLIKDSGQRRDKQVVWVLAGEAAA